MEQEKQDQNASIFKRLLGVSCNSSAMLVHGICLGTPPSTLPSWVGFKTLPTARAQEKANGLNGGHQIGRMNRDLSFGPVRHAFLQGFVF